MDQIRISGKDLGQMALAGFCPRCFWIKRHFKLPYQIFPGIFSSLDSYSKKITWLHYQKYKALPSWFTEQGIAGEPVKVPSTKVFQVLDEETNVLLTGVPDDMLRNGSGYTIVDYKTAKYTGNQDALLPMYSVQLNSYAYITQKIGMGAVDKLWLVYYEPQTDIDDSDAYSNGHGFAMNFTSSFHELPMDLTQIPPLLKKLREIYDLPEPPEGKEGCKDCASLMEITGKV